MNFLEAIAVYSGDETYENICNDVLSITLICDRNTKRIFKIDGNYPDMTTEMLTSNDWYVKKND